MPHNVFYRRSQTGMNKPVGFQQGSMYAALHLGLGGKTPLCFTGMVGLLCAAHGAMFSAPLVVR